VPRSLGPRNLSSLDKILFRYTSSRSGVANFALMLFPSGPPAPSSGWRGMARPAVRWAGARARARTAKLSPSRALLMLLLAEWVYL
jgi:hypothetical protein